MTLNQWRNDAMRCAEMGKVLSGQIMSEAVACLLSPEELPTSVPQPMANGSSADDKIMAYGVTVGYLHAFAKLRSLAVFNKPQEPLQSTFAPLESE